MLPEFNLMMPQTLPEALDMLAEGAPESWTCAEAAIAPVC